MPTTKQYPMREADRLRLYPDSKPSQRPAIDQTVPAWWCPVEEERLLTAAMIRAKCAWDSACSASGMAYEELLWGRATADQVAEARTIRDAAKSVYEEAKVALRSYIRLHGSVIDNGSLRYEYPVGYEGSVEV